MFDSDILRQPRSPLNILLDFIVQHIQLLGGAAPFPALDIVVSGGLYELVKPVLQGGVGIGQPPLAILTVASNYQKLYCQLFNALTDHIESMKAIQQQAEESYIRQAGVISVPEYIKIIELEENVK